MRTLTIAAIAMAVTASSLAPQGPPQRAQQEIEAARAELLQRQAELMKRLEELRAQVPTRRDEARLAAELRELEAALAAVSARLHEPLSEVHELQRQEALTRELQQHIIETHARQAELAAQLHEQQAATQHREQAALAEQVEALAQRAAEMREQELAALTEQREALARARAEMREQERAASSERAEALAQRAAEMREQELAARTVEAEAVARRAAELAAGLEERAGARDADLRRSLDRLYGDGPLPSWVPQDPADSLWRAARDLLNRGNHEQAARLFARIHQDEQYARSAYRADAFYWHAFALNRMGSEESVRQALDVLTALTREYPPDQRPADTNALLTTVQVYLAERGNTVAEREVRAIAEADRVRSVAQARDAYAAAVNRARAADQANAVQAEQLVRLAERQRAYADAVALTTAHELNYAAGLPLNYMAELNPQCADDDSEIRLIALNSLLRMDTAAVVSVLREVMDRRDECAAGLRHSALLIAARMQDPDMEAILAEAARSDPEPAVRRSALVYLGSRNADLAVGIASEALDAAPDDEAREGALQVLARMRDDRAWRVLRAYAARSDVPAAARRAAIASLSQSRDSANAAFLRDLYGQVGDDQALKEAILMSSAFRRGHTDSGWLSAIARNQNEDQRLREFAISALSRNPDVETATFVALYDESSDQSVKLASLRALSDRARTETVAVDKLIMIARTETDPELRRTAVMGLAGTNDPRAIDVLLEIVRR